MFFDSRRKAFLSLPADINGTVKIPSSKSVVQRAIACAILSEGETVLRNANLCDDVLSAVSVARSLGAEIKACNNEIIVKPDFRLETSVLDCGESGLSARMFLPIAALTGREFMLTGTGTLLKRSMRSVSRELTKFGLDVEGRDNLPFLVRGQLECTRAILDASDTSQLLTGLLIAFSKKCKYYELEVKNLKSTYYINLTIDILKKFGIIVKNVDYRKFVIENNEFVGTELEMEGDWSGAAFWFVAAAIAGKIKICGLDKESVQPDKAILDVLEQANVKYKFEGRCYVVEQSDIKPFVFDATHTPDLFPPLAVLAVFAKGKSKIKGISRLINKESNRAYAISSGLSNLGVEVELEKDEMIIYGQRKIKGGEFKTFDDHRMAMAGLILGLGSIQGIRIDNVDCLKKSYPGFLDDLLELKM